MSTPHQTSLAPLAKLALRHPLVEGQAIWWEEGDWQAQDDEEAMIDGEEIAYYAEGLLAEGFGLHWQVLAEADAPKEPVLVLLFLWQFIKPFLIKNSHHFNSRLKHHKIFHIYHKISL